MAETTSKGWIPLNRVLLDKPVWINSSPEQKTILIALLLMVNHADNEWEFMGKPYKVKAGQMITSLESIKQKCGKGISLQNIRTALKRFEKLGFLTEQTTKVNRLITITDTSIVSALKTNPTEQTTISQQRPNNHPTTNNNVNNNNNENTLIPLRAESGQDISFIKEEEVKELSLSGLPIIIKEPGGTDTDHSIQDDSTDTTRAMKVPENGLSGQDAKMFDGPDFEEFWSAYGKDVARTGAQGIWKSLPKEDKLAAIAYIPSYKARQRDVQYRKNPDNYLRNRVWEDKAPAAINHTGPVAASTDPNHYKGDLRL
ncbi:MAG: hypothetical protein WBM13_13045 [Bacteroidia bacterium]